MRHAAIFGTLAALLVATPARAQPDGGAVAQTGAAATAATEESPSMTLREAYQREFAFLAGQKRQLEERLGQVEKQNAQAQRSLQAEIEAQEARLLRLEDRAKALREQLGQAEQAQQSSIDDEQLVGATLDQARTTLGDYGVEVPEAKEGDDRAVLLRERFRQAVTLLERLSSVTERTGEFFARDGTKVEGNIVEVGRVGAYGVGGDTAGALAPAGGGKLKVWKDATGDTARALLDGRVPDSLSIFLFESLDAKVDDGEGETVLEHVDSGGVIAWVIMALGALGVLLASVRALILGGAASNTQKLERAVGERMQAGDYAAAVDYARRAKGSAARVVASVLEAFRSGVDDIEDVVSESLLSENRRLSRFGAVILVIAAVAPLLGLLGTVTGMISTFDVITKYGTGDPKMLSGGISTALVTTELGLIVAIPTLLLGNLLKGWGDGIESEIERTVLRVVNVHKDLQRAGGSPPA